MGSEGGREVPLNKGYGDSSHPQILLADVMPSQHWFLHTHLTR